MKKKIIILISLLLLTFYENITAEIIKKTSNYDKTKVLNLIEQVQGGIPKKEMKYIDSEIMDLNGNKINIKKYEGKVILLNLWATWCPPCRQEMPSIEKLYKKFKDKDFIILAVDQGENLKSVKNFLKNNKYTFPIFIDINNEVSKNYNTGSIPTTYIIDKDGFIIAGFIGGRDWYSAIMIELIKELIK